MKITNVNFMQMMNDEEKFMFCFNVCFAPLYFRCHDRSLVFLFINFNENYMQTIFRPFPSLTRKIAFLSLILRENCFVCFLTRSYSSTNKYESFVVTFPSP